MIYDVGLFCCSNRIHFKTALWLGGDGLCCAVTQSCLTLCDPLDCKIPGFPVLYHLPELAGTHVHWVSDAIQPSILCHPLLPASIFPSIRVFSNESALCIRWPKYWSFSIFRTDWFNLLSLQGTLKCLPQHHRSKASILRCSAFFTVRLSYPYMTVEKYIYSC